MKSNYSPRISFVLYIWVLISFLLAGLVSWSQYGFKKHFPSRVSVVLPKETTLTIGEDGSSLLLKAGEQVSIMAFENRNIWVETSNHTRGLIHLEAVPNWQSISEREDMQYELQRENCINISYEQMCEQFLGRTFEENETNYWPALYCVHKGEKLYATYLLRMWKESECSLPIICYEDNKAVSVQAGSPAPFKGNKQWLRFTPWAQWLYTEPFFHWHWDRPMLESSRMFCDSWWWIFRVPVKLIVLVLALIVSLFWVTVIFGFFVFLMQCLIPFRYPFWHLSNSALTMLMVVVSAASCYFFMPFLLLYHGGFLTICIMLVVFCLLCALNLLIIEERCETCRCLGFIKVIRKEYTHTKTTESEEKVLDKQRSTYQVSIYQIYKVIKEKKYYDHYCTCQVCQAESIRKDQLGETKETKEPTGKFITEVHTHSSSRGSSSSPSDSSSDLDKERRKNPYDSYNQKEGFTCFSCKYFQAGGCTYYGDNQFIRADTTACYNWNR